MSIVPPLGSSRATRWTADSSAVGEHFMLHVGRLNRPQGDIPVVYFHDYLADALTTRDGAYNELFTALTSTSYPVMVPELGSTSQWATPDVVDAGGWVDDAVAWASTTAWAGTDPTKVAVVGVGMGSLNALNWAWRNPGRVVSLVLVGPIVDADKFYDDNPSLQAAINADWGSGAAWTAALPTIDPMQNLDLIRPFGHKIQLWYGDTDTQIDPADVQAFAELVGAEAVEFAGNESQRHLAPAGRISIFTLATIRDRDRAYVGWDDRDWARFTEIEISIASDTNTNELRTGVFPGGRRGEFHRVQGSDGNERHAYLLGEVSAPDTMVKTIWYQNNSGQIAGQHGNVHRAVIDPDASTYNLHMTWTDIFAFTPWKINMAVWEGTYGPGGVLNLLGATNADIPGLRLSAGGEVLASQRIGGVVTLVLHAEDLDRSFVGNLIDVDITGPLGNHFAIEAVRVDANHIQYAQAGVDILNGGAGSWGDFEACFPYHADTQLVGTTMTGRFYPLGMDPPGFDDPDWTFSWEDTGGWGSNAYAPSGLLLAHVGIFASPADAPTFLQVGPVTIDEL